MPRVSDPALLAQLETTQTHINSAAPAGAAQVSPQDLAAVRNEAVNKIKLAQSLQDRSRNGWFTTGFGSGVARLFGGTGANDVASDTATLQNAAALRRVMELAKENGGKNPLTPLSEGDFKAISQSVTNLDPSQSDNQFQNNINRVAEIYGRAYAGAGGRDLRSVLAGRKMPGAPVARKQAPVKVINFSDLKD